MLLAVVVLYANATLTWILPVLSMAKYAAIANSVTKYAQTCMEAYAGGEPCGRRAKELAAKLIADESPKVGIPGQNCIPTAVLAMNMPIGDFIVLWRAWVLWKQNQLFSMISLVLLLGSVAMSGLATSHACEAWKGPIPSYLFQYDAAGLAAFTLSLVINLWATSLIGCRAWQHRRLIKEYLRRSGTYNLVEKTLALIIESGILYCLTWIFVVASTALGFDYHVVRPDSRVPSTASRFISAWDVFWDGALLHVIGIYPTIVIVLVALEKSHLDRNFTYDRPISIPLSFQPAASGFDMQMGHMRAPEQSYVHDQV
ncbi:hypothetical protein OF83DRAFT_463500 [Amylostereum chailletii]|nr:hypothetical protein OF83DRAFT_463500 [Amylostereum chailletii]